MTLIQCFMLEPTDRVRQDLRRYTHSRWDAERKVSVYDAPDCPLTGTGYHNAQARVEDAPVVHDTRDGFQEYICNGTVGELERYAADPRWPTHCACGYSFTDADARQVFCEQLYRRADTGEETTTRDAPAGAIWYAQWVAHFYRPQLPGGPIIVKLPDGTDWQVDSQATNCTISDDYKQERHHCWVIEGEPPRLDVGKAGPTCSAGAGSIASPRWHGFLTYGYLSESRIPQPADWSATPAATH